MCSTPNGIKGNRTFIKVGEERTRSRSAQRLTASKVIARSAKCPSTSDEFRAQRLTASKVIARVDPEKIAALFSYVLNA